LQAELAADSDSEEDESFEAEDANNDTLDVATEEENDDVDEVALSELESDVDADAADMTPKTRETVNNTAALEAAYKRIALPLPKHFSHHHTLFTDEPVLVQDIDDDLNRELVFYKQALTHARVARTLIQKEGGAWERPADYFAEMVKTDDHMERIRKEQVAEATGKKASAEAKKQRELKKFGKQVQISKTLEREKEKKTMTDKVKSLKRKRGAELEGKEDFDVALDEAAAAPGRNAKRGGGASRESRDKKYGHGGKKRFAKSNDALSSGDVTSFSGRGGRG
ncbi:eukaryotic rRNA processing, partial [Protomyces lactucae-debilis]